MNRGYRDHPPTAERPRTHGSKAPPLGDMVESISRDELSGKDVRAEIQNVKFVASYNWVSSSSPKIIIPGMSAILLMSASNIIRPTSKMDTTQRVKPLARGFGGLLSRHECRILPQTPLGTCHRFCYEDASRAHPCQYRRLRKFNRESSSFHQRCRLGQLLSYPRREDW